MTEVDLVLDAGALLGESPVWDQVLARLLWVDIDRGLVHLFAPDTGEDVAFSVGQEVGAVSPCSRDGLILAVRDGFATLDLESGDVELVAAVERDRAHNRMNDGACDTRGRFWAGTMSVHRDHGAGALYRLDPGLRSVRVLDGVSISNGIGWSPDDRWMYFIDSPTGRVDVFNFDRDTGTLHERRTLTLVSPPEGKPDGLAVDSDGFVWVALWGASAVQRYAPDGRPDRRVELPVTQVTSCCFGGPGLSTLYITTAARGLGSAARQAGAIFACRPGVAGLPAGRFEG